MDSPIVSSALVAPGHLVGGSNHFGGAFFPYQRNMTVVDTLPADMLPMIHEHWYQFPPINPLWHSLLGVAIIVLGIISVLGNGMVIYLTFSTKNLKTPTNMLIVNLAFSDFCMMAFMMPTMAANCFAELGF
uniref:Kumopsin n=1 Tax=Scytodes thoracica TaxID=1112478 RepID=A0A0A0V9K9_SCYTH|nr:kumopsin [Scytodes thoracica]